VLVSLLVELHRLGPPSLMTVSFRTRRTISLSPAARRVLYAPPDRLISLQP
jgi:hypothetical protein